MTQKQCIDEKNQRNLLQTLACERWTGQTRRPIGFTWVPPWERQQVVGASSGGGGSGGGSGNASIGGQFSYISPEQAIRIYSNTESFRQLTALEQFNNAPVVDRYLNVISGSSKQPPYSGFLHWYVDIAPQRAAFFDAAYKALEESTYKSLYLQTAGKAYLDLIELVIDDKGLRLDFGKVNAAIDQQAALDPTQAAVNLAEFMHFTRGSLGTGSGWDGAASLPQMQGAALCVQRLINIADR